MARVEQDIIQLFQLTGLIGQFAYQLVRLAKLTLLDVALLLVNFLELALDEGKEIGENRRREALHGHCFGLGPS